MKLNDSFMSIKDSYSPTVFKEVTTKHVSCQSKFMMCPTFVLKYTVSGCPSLVTVLLGLYNTTCHEDHSHKIPIDAMSYFLPQTLKNSVFFCSEWYFKEYHPL